MLYTFHFYEPHYFTHQGVDDEDTKLIRDLRWPPDPQNIADCKALALARLETYARRGGARPDGYRAGLLRADDYARNGPGLERVQGGCLKIANWASKAGVGPDKILLGRIRLRSHAGRKINQADRAFWLTTVRQLAEKHAFPWAYWAYKGYGGMVLDDDADKIDASVATASAL